MRFLLGAMVVTLASGTMVLGGEVSGELQRAPWSGTYWALKTCETAFASWGQGLAPFEKYDNYVFVTKGKNPGATVREADPANGHNEASLPNGESWTGHCHGWAPASLLEAEPPEVVTIKLDEQVRFLKLKVKNAASAKKGISKNPAEAYTVRKGNPDKALELHSADTKAMLTEIYTETRTHFWGNRYDGRNPNRTDPAYLDIKPNIMHQLLVQYIKEKNEGLVFDIDPGYMVWNQPVYKFESKWTENGGKLQVTTTVWYADDNGVDPNFHGLIHKNKTYTYTLKRDSQGNIVDGEWTGSSIDDHPDFVWHPYGVLSGQNVAGLELGVVREMIAKNGQTVAVVAGQVREGTESAGSDSSTSPAGVASVDEAAGASRSAVRRDLWRRREDVPSAPSRRPTVGETE